MTDKIKPENDYSKEELVYALSLMLWLQDMPHELSKLSKPALWRLYDGFKERGTNFAVLEEKLRDSEREANELRTRAISAERKVATMESQRNARR